MNSFISVLIGSILLTTGFAFPNPLDNVQVKFNQTEVNQLIYDLNLIQPVSFNTIDELNYYALILYKLNLINQINRTKSISSIKDYNQVKDFVEELHYDHEIDLLNVRKMKKQFIDIFDKLYDLRSKLIEKNIADAIQIIRYLLESVNKMIQILERNLVYDQDKAKSLLKTANYAIDKYSKQIKLN